MTRRKLALVLFLGIVVSLKASADDGDSLVKFKGGIGVSPVRYKPGLMEVEPNVARGVNPGRMSWVALRFEAEVATDGRIWVEGKILVAGGDGIGTRGMMVTSVFAQLFCGTGTGTVAHNTEVVPLAPNGEFSIDGRLTPVPPNPCVKPALLIRRGDGPMGWLAAGIPVDDRDDDRGDDREE